ncbi:NAD(P)H-binding protein [Endozoicomonadaceae bacterium StTr2]
MGKTAVVIGATGVVGRSLVDLLAQSDAIRHVVTLTRRPAVHESTKVKNHVIDFEHLDYHAKLFAGDMMFSCLGTTLKQAGSIANQRKVDFDYQHQAAQLAAEQGIEHYLLVSSSGANSQSNAAYFRMKGELEQQVKHLPFNRISIFQPSLLVGERPDFRLGESIGRVIMPVLCRLPGLKKYRPVTGKQVAAAMVKTALQPGLPVEIFALDKILTI